MKRLVIPIALLLLMALFLVSQAKTLTISIPRWSVGEGSTVTGSDYKLSSIANQPIAGRQSGGDYNLRWGFWQPINQDRMIYLPVVVNSE